MNIHTAGLQEYLHVGEENLLLRPPPVKAAHAPVSCTPAMKAKQCAQCKLMFHVVKVSSGGDINGNLLWTALLVGVQLK
jgi:hypothetical protein